MADRRREDSADNCDDYIGADDGSNNIGSSIDNPRTNSGRSGSGSTSVLANRLSDILVADADGDLLLQQSDRESCFLQWLQALDMQVMGACRSDERLKPLLKVNTSTGVAEDLLLAHLSKHFDASEVGLLARCLCVPLVSMRAGEMVKQGTRLCPTSLRGMLNVFLLPSSDLRVTFVGDDGHARRLATLSPVVECSDVAVEEISADESGRSFLIKVGGEIFYFWCAEISMLLGAELLSKMKELLATRPTLAELTGISGSRLECFATNIRTNLAGSRVNAQASIAAASSAPLVDTRPDTVEHGPNAAQSLSSTRHLHPRQTLKGLTQYQGSLSPRSSSFKETSPRLHSSSKIAALREKVKRRGDLHLPTNTSSFMTDVFNHNDDGKHSETCENTSISSLSYLESLGNCKFPPPSATSPFTPISSYLPPYYCWCPPCTSPTMSTTDKLPIQSNELPTLPPLASLISATGLPSLLSQLPPLDFTGVPPLSLPGLVSDPSVRYPFSNPTTSSKQIPTFTPLTCDSIVHIPVLDICSSGQGYLVSTGGPAIATSIPPLHSKLVGPMMADTESMVDKGARETLRLLIGSSAGCQPSAASFMGVLPAVLKEDKQGVGVAGSRGLYTGTNDVGAIVNSFAAVGLVSLSERSLNVGNMRRVCSSAVVQLQMVWAKVLRVWMFLILLLPSRKEKRIVKNKYGNIWVLSSFCSSFFSANVELKMGKKKEKKRKESKNVISFVSFVFEAVKCQCQVLRVQLILLNW